LNKIKIKTKNMKKTLLKITVLTLLAVGVAGAPALCRAADDTAAPAKKGKSAGEKFYGPITAVDTNAMTFVVSDQTFTLTSKSEITSAKDDSKATIAEAVVGQPARGTYTKTSDGKNEVTKVRFGKKAGGAGAKAGGKSGSKKKKDATTDDSAAPAAPTTPAKE
jgi:hypothetical protein